jgi:hypothetical protein
VPDSTWPLRSDRSRLNTTKGRFAADLLSSCHSGTYGAARAGRQLRVDEERRDVVVNHAIPVRLSCACQPPSTSTSKRTGLVRVQFADRWRRPGERRSPRPLERLGLRELDRLGERPRHRLVRSASPRSVTSVRDVTAPRKSAVAASASHGIYPMSRAFANWNQTYQRLRQVDAFAQIASADPAARRQPPAASFWSPSPLDR